MLLISGLSGAGKSTVLHALEDAGYFCTDNLPLELLRDWSRQMLARNQPAAVCLDVRSCPDRAALAEAIEAVLVSGDPWQLVFVEAEDEVLARRFSTVRRRHPFAPERDLLEAIQSEREALQPVRAIADLVLDSSQTTPYELAEQAQAYIRQEAETAERPIRCTLVSFSFQRGLPRQADMVVDVRFLPNPHYVPELAPLTGRDEPVAAFLQARSEVAEAERRIRDWLAFAWPGMQKERKQYFTLAFGCSGGRHRSVYLAERTALWLAETGRASPAVHHRELGLILDAGAGQ